MAVMDLKLDAEAVATLASKAIFDSLDQHRRDEVVKQAIQGLLVPEKGDRYAYNYGKTPLQVAFDQAVGIAAQKVVREAVEADPAVQQAIRDLVSPTITEICEGNYDGLPEKIGEAIGAWLRDKSAR